VSSGKLRAWAEIDLSAVAHNLSLFRTLHPGRTVIAVVKADAYGHGTVEVSRRVIAEGAEMLAVACIDEGGKLREAGIEVPVLLLGAYTREECREILGLGLHVSVSSLDFARALDEAAHAKGVAAPVHINIDTGMGRLGMPCATAIEEVEQISVLPSLDLQGIYTHFAESEAEDREFTLHQVEAFRRVLDALSGTGIRFRYEHLANSAAVLDVPESAFNCLRPGISLYGLRPDPCCACDVDLRPAMKFCARVVSVRKHEAGSTIGYNRTCRLSKDTRVAVISAGYADGYDRRFSNMAVVTIRGSHAPVLGRVSMDLISVDVSQIRNVAPGDEAVLFSNEPKAPNSVECLAQMTGTIPHVLTCGVSKRVQRVYVN